MQFIWQSSNSVFDSHNAKRIKFINRLRLGFSHLPEHKFKHNFQESNNLLCNCGYEVEFTVYFFLHCPLFPDERITFFNTLSNLDCKLFNNTNSLLTYILLFGKESLNTNQNMTILNLTIEFILSTKIFSESLFIN